MKWINNLSVAKKLLFVFLFVLIPIMGMSLVVNNMSMQIASRKILESYSNSLLLLGQKLDDSLEKYRHLASAIAVDPDIKAVDVSSSEKKGDAQYSNALKKVLNNIRLYSYTNEIESDITVYLPKASRYVSSQWGMDFIYASDPVMEKSRTDPYKWFCRTKKYGNSSKEVFTFIQNSVFNLPGYGIIVTIDIEITKLRRLLEEYKSPEDSGSFIILPDGRFIDHSSGQKIDIDAVFDFAGDYSGNLGLIDQNNDGISYKVIFYKSPATGFVSGIYLAETKILQPIIMIRAYIIAFILIGIVLALFFSYSTYKNLLIPFHKIVDAMKQVKNGNLKVRIPEGDNGEMAFIFSQFNNMASQIDYLINEEYENRMRLQKSNLKLLHSQIKPHFLFNCLNFIYRMSISEDLEGVGKMSLFLGKYFRYAIRVDKDYTTLNEELENISAYVQIQNLRFPGRINIVQNIPYEAGFLNIPKLLIQPIVENSILHGLEKIDETITIEVTAVASGDSISITVEDDGKGIGNDDLVKILQNMREMKDDDSSYGLSNINWRLKLEYGEKADIVLEQRLPKGTRVEITIPVNAKGERDNV